MNLSKQTLHVGPIWLVRCRLLRRGRKLSAKDVFGDYTQVQRCTWHKRENMVSKLTKKEDAPKVRRIDAGGVA